MQAFLLVICPWKKKLHTRTATNLNNSHISYLSDIPSGYHACATHIPEIFDSILFAGNKKE